MSKRLQVLIDETEYAVFHETARRNGMTLAEWVRQALRAANRQEPGASAERKLAAIRHAAGLRFPVSDIDEMLADIEAGYGEGVAP